MMNDSWNCYVCMAYTDEIPNAAVTFVNGTAVCRHHILAIGNSNVMEVGFLRDHRMITP